MLLPRSAGAEEVQRQVRLYFGCKENDNYLAELGAIIAVLTVVPRTSRLRIFSDSFSAIQAITRGRIRDWSGAGDPDSNYGLVNGHTLSIRDRITCAARPLMTVIRRLLALHEHPVEFAHVYSHTEGTDRRSVLNAVADVLANTGRVAAGGAPGMCLRASSLDAVPASLTIKGWGRVLGSYKAALDKKSKGRLTDKWAALPRQGRLVRAARDPVLTLLKTIVRTRDPKLVRFVLLSSSEWLPTERRLTVSRRDHGRGEACKLCGMDSDTNAHAAVGCPVTTAKLNQAAMASDAAHRLILTGFGAAAGVSGMVLRALPAWYDPSGQLVVWVQAHLRKPWLVTKYLGHDPLAAAIGVLPPGLCALGLCADGDWDRLLSAGVDVARRAMGVYETRRRLMRTWWDSDAGRSHWPAAVRGQLYRIAAIARKREEKGASKFLLDHPEEQGSRKRTRVKEGLRPFSPSVDYFAPVITSTPIEEAEDAYLGELEKVAGLLRPAPPPSY